MQPSWVLATVALWSSARAFADPPSKPDLDSVAAKLTFEPGRTSLTAAAKTALRPVLETLQARRSTRLVIVGHYAADTGPQMDVTARRRADVVKWFLVDNGIETDRIDARVSPVTVTGRIIELQLGNVPEQAPRAATRPATPAVVAPPAPTTNDTLGASITFASGRTSLTTAAKAGLGPVVELLHAQPTMRLLIIGHVGADTLATAKRRVEVVKWYLVDDGIETDRIDTSVSATRGTVIELRLADSRHVDSRAVAAVVSAPTVADPAPNDAARDASQMAKLLGDEAESSSVAHRTAGANLAAQIAAAHAQTITIGSDEAGFRGGDPIHLETATSFDVHSPMLVSSTAKHAEDDVGRTVPGSPHVDQPLTRSETILRKLHARYTRRLSRCYRKTLLGNPELSGRVSLSFMVDQAGKVIDPAVEADDPDLSSCIRAQMKLWRFDPTPDGKASPRTTVTTTMMLRAK